MLINNGMQSEKIAKYFNLIRQLKKLWNMKVTLIPIVVGALETVPKGLWEKSFHYNNYYFLFWEFFTPALADSFFYWSLSDSKLPQVFWTILIMLTSGWSLLVLLFTSLPVPSPTLWGLSQVYQRQLVSLSPLCRKVFFLISLARSRYLSLFSLSYFHSVIRVKLHYSAGSLFLLLFWEFFTTTFVDGFSLEFEWRRVS